MENKYTQIRFGKLTKEQQKTKLQKDSEYEIAVQNLSTAFYQKKRSVGITLEEEAAYKANKKVLWDDYLTWAKANGLYKTVTPEEQLAEAESGFNRELEELNQKRIALGQCQLEVKEVVRSL